VRRTTPVGGAWRRSGAEPEGPMRPGGVRPHVSAVRRFIGSSVHRFIGSHDPAPPAGRLWPGLVVIGVNVVHGASGVITPILSRRPRTTR
jgi:hypothetical protein